MKSRKINGKLLAEAIDPKFSHVYSNTGPQDISPLASQRFGKGSERPHGTKIKATSERGMDNIFAQELSELVERSIKVVDSSETTSCGFPDEGGIKLFSDSKILSTIARESEVPRPAGQSSSRIRKKMLKNRNKSDEKRKLQEVAVSASWVVEQSKIYNS